MGEHEKSDITQPGEVKPRLPPVFLNYNYESDGNASWADWVAVSRHAAC